MHLHWMQEFPERLHFYRCFLLLGDELRLLRLLVEGAGLISVVYLLSLAQTRPPACRRSPLGPFDLLRSLPRAGLRGQAPAVCLRWAWLLQDSRAAIRLVGCWEGSRPSSLRCTAATPLSGPALTGTAGAPHFHA